MTSTSVVQSVSYGYTNGNRTSLTTPSGQTITYGHAHGRIASITLNGSTTILSDVLHDPFDAVTGWEWGNSTLAVRTYDADGKIEAVDSAGATTYGYDDAFRITGITDLDDSSRSWTYGYDLLDRLTSGSKTGHAIGYSYDANGNRLTQTGTQTATYTVSGSSNRVSTITGTPARTYSYDAAGNTTGYGGLTFAYSDAGRMKSVTDSSGTTNYILNALGQRVKKSGPGGTRLFVYDEAGHLLGEYDASGTLIQETVWMGDIPVATLRPNGGGVSLFYVHSDHLNTPRRVSRPSDNVIVWRWDSDPFGSTSPNEDPDGDTSAFTYALRLPGQYRDVESGLSYNVFRNYDPGVGRYVESDPIGLDGGINTYAYVGASPLKFADPWGLARCAYSIAQHSIICISKHGSVIWNKALHSGYKKCRDNVRCVDDKNDGPVPPDTYNVTANTLPGREGWALQSTSWSPNVDGIKCRLGLKRCGFNLHTGTYSRGCITFELEDPKAVDAFNRISELFAKDAQNTLIVIPNIRRVSQE